jgi:hypothetical protein
LDVVARSKLSAIATKSNQDFDHRGNARLSIDKELEAPISNYRHHSKAKGVFHGI